MEEHKPSSFIWDEAKERINVIKHGVDFKTAKLVDIRSGDDAAIEWLMNGKGKEFYGENDNTYAVTSDGEFEIYPEYKKRVDPIFGEPSLLKTIRRKVLRYTPTQSLIMSASRGFRFIPFGILVVLALVLIYFRKVRSK